MPATRGQGRGAGSPRRSGTKERARSLYESQLRSIAARSDRFIALALACQWGLTVVLSLLKAKGTGLAGLASVGPTLALGILLVGPPIALGLARPGWLGTRLAIAVGQMGLSGLLIHLTNGRIETHFHVFGSLALLSSYRDARVLVVASLVTTIDHMMRGIFWPMSIYGVATADTWRWAEHAAWVVFEDIFLFWFCWAGCREILRASMRRAMLEDIRARVETTVQVRTAELADRARQMGRLACELAEANAHGKAVLDSATSVAIMSTNPEGVVTIFNKGAERMLGYASDEVVGRVTPEIWHLASEVEAQGAVLSEALGEQVEGMEVFITPTRIGGTYEREWTFVRKDGAHLTVALVVTMVRDSRGAIVGYLGIGRDVTAERLAEQERRKFDALVENSSDFIALTDLDGRLIHANESARCIAPHPDPADPDALRLRDLFTPDAWGQIRDEALPTVDAEGGWEGETQLRDARDDGRPLDVSLNLFAIPDAVTGRPTGHALVARDLTERKRAEGELIQAKLAAEAASRIKSEFLANVSHEIRTPMNGIIGMTELALDTNLDRDQREYLGMVRSSANALLVVINDILDFSKVEAGKLQLNPVDFSLRDCLGETLKVLGLRAHESGLELAHEIRADVPDILFGDDGRLRQVIVNLVGNAIKFTREGEVVVVVEAGRVDEENATLLFSIRDTGIGIPPEKLDAIWAPFEQADGSTSRHYGGTGLGLSISTRLVEMMGGRIWVESTQGVGSTFHFDATFGLGEVDIETSPFVPDIDLHGLPILIVDDNATNRRILQETTLQWGLRPVAVESGAAALELLRSSPSSGPPFRLILSDLMMPGMDGFDLIEQVRACPQLDAIPVILLSSAGPGTVEQCRSLKIARYLAKPVKQSELFEAILEVLGQAAIAGPDPEPDPAPSRTAPPLPASGALRLLVVEDNRVNQMLATRLLERAGHAIKVVGDGRIALDTLAADPDAFDLVLMDIQMPNLGGIEAVGLIRLDPRLRHLRVVAMTAHALKGDREHCLDSGFDGYISKPLSMERIAAEIERLIPGRPTGVGVEGDFRYHPAAPDPDLTDRPEPAPCSMAAPKPMLALASSPSPRSPS